MSVNARARAQRKLPAELVPAQLCKNNCRGRDGQPRKVHAHGLCNVCYRVEVWKPRGHDAVERERERNAALARRRQRAEREANGAAGRPRKNAKCEQCGKFKQRPSSVCGACGYEPGTYNGDAYEYDRAAGWDSY